MTRQFATLRGLGDLRMFMVDGNRVLELGIAGDHGTKCSSQLSYVDTVRLRDALSALLGVKGFASAKADVRPTVEDDGA